MSRSCPAHWSKLPNKLEIPTSGPASPSARFVYIQNSSARPAPNSPRSGTPPERRGLPGKQRPTAQITEHKYRSLLIMSLVMRLRWSKSLAGAPVPKAIARGSARRRQVDALVSGQAIRERLFLVWALLQQVVPGRAATRDPCEIVGVSLLAIVRAIVPTAARIASNCSLV